MSYFLYFGHAKNVQLASESKGVAMSKEHPTPTVGSGVRLLAKLTNVLQPCQEPNGMQSDASFWFSSEQGRGKKSNYCLPTKVSLELVRI